MPVYHHKIKPALYGLFHDLARSLEHHRRLYNNSTPSSAALVKLANSAPLFLSTSSLSLSVTAPCKTVFSYPEDLKISVSFLWTKVCSSLYFPMAAGIFLRTSSLKMVHVRQHYISSQSPAFSNFIDKVHDSRGGGNSSHFQYRHRDQHQTHSACVYALTGGMIKYFVYNWYLAFNDKGCMSYNSTILA